ncbi:hypothetical protein BGZ67_006382 [Mortierella alpina]|nr:hypothetical protein BGZ67_006382 [Mortierella alpina]
MTLLNQHTQGQFRAFLAFAVFNTAGLIVEAWPRGQTEVQRKGKASRSEKANLFSRILFHYMQPLILQGFKAPLSAKDIMGVMPQRIKTENSYGLLNSRWEKAVEKSNAHSKNKRLSLFWTVLIRNGWSLIHCVILRISASTCNFVPPVLLSKFLGFIGSYSTSRPQPVVLGVILAFGMFFATLVGSLFAALYLQNAMSFGVEARTALVAMIYRKSLRLSIYEQIGWSVFVGLAAAILTMPIQALLARFLTTAKSQKLKAMDERILLMNEILASIKTVKLYGWEDSFKNRITAFRNRELSFLRRIGCVFSVLSITFRSMSLLIALVSFSVYASAGGPDFAPGDITPQRIFVSITLIELLNRNLSMISQVITTITGLTVATRRIQKFLLAEEISENSTESIKTLPNDPLVPLVEIKDGIFAWGTEGLGVETEEEKRRREKMEDKRHRQLVKEALKAGNPVPERQVPTKKSYDPVLKGIHLTIARGSLTAVVGRVGQGKSSLLHAIIGDIYKRQGSVKVYGRIAHVAQQAWIVNATVKENIVFGYKFDQARYDSILMACALLPDIERLPAGDQTEIGERGINLSGGQKQRVSLARAAYSDADVYLLDDPLSAVDAHVDQHLWQHLIGPNGLLKCKTRVLVTHGIHHFEQTDQIVVVKDREITEMGQYGVLMDNRRSFYQLVNEYSVVKSSSRQEKAKSTVSAGIEELINDTDDDTDTSMDDEDGKDAKTLTIKKDDKGLLTEEEEMVHGNVARHIYRVYAKAASYKYSILVVCLFIFLQSLQIGTNIWLKHWANVAGTGRHTLAEILAVYIILVASFIATSAIVTYIVNRFSSDVYNIDEYMPVNVIQFMLCITAVFGTTAVIATTTPIFLSIVPPLVIIFLFVQMYYLRTSRALKRIDSITKSPIYQHFSETLAGVTTIRAFDVQDRFIYENATKADASANAYFSWMTMNRWLQIRLESLGALVVLAAALFAILRRQTLGAANVGLQLAYALSVTQNIAWLVRSYCDLNNQLVAVERVEEYASKDPEASPETDVTLPENWPQEGRVEFRNYSTRYREGLDLVIKNISFTVQPAEKVGIVGRTGAGKSSLTLALFRIIEAVKSPQSKASHNSSTNLGTELKREDELRDIDSGETNEGDDGGSIWVDGVDISTVGLKHLRQRLAIIPQDPILYHGTVRENLDPFEEMQDADLWAALERAHLKEHISSLEGGLSSTVSQNGDNFSVGQRSLICLARALLRKTKILVLDEATAALDVQTDELIQRTIREEFKDRTILMIAHRIRTVMDSNKILVLEKGRVQEFGNPEHIRGVDNPVADALSRHYCTEEENDQDDEDDYHQEARVKNVYVGDEDVYLRVYLVEQVRRIGSDEAFDENDEYADVIFILQHGHFPASH